MTEAGPGRAVHNPPPGWYPDPWTPDHHRYWGGTTWTSDVFPNGPAAPTPSAAEPPRDAVASPPADENTRRATTSGASFVALVVVLMLVVGSLAVVGGYYAFGRRSPSGATALRPTPVSPTAPTAPPSPRPTVPADPLASVLSGLVVTQGDVGAAGLVLPQPTGDQLSVATLDLCRGSFPSEALRSARLQVSVVAAAGATTPLSTEAVLYSAPAATVQAFTELRAVTGACGGSTHFNASPDGGWPQVPTVDRLAYDFVTAAADGTTEHDVAVYLRRGRVLMGVYFYLPAAEQLTVAGQTTMAGITDIFANRIAKLPDAVVGA